MGYQLHVVERIGSPFLVVHEQIVLVPAGGGRWFHNPVRKLIFFLHGECRHQVAGAAGSDADVHVKAGDILVVPYRCEQRYLPLNSGSACRLQALRMAFDPHALAPLPLTHRRTATDGDVDSDLAAFSAHHFQDLRHLPGGQDAPIRETLGQVREEAQQRLPGYTLRVRGLCTGLVTLVARQVMEAARSGVSRTDQRLDYHVLAAKDYLLRHLNQPLRLGQVAAHAQISEEHLARLFKQVTGQTVFAYVRQMRLEQAKTYLAGSEKNVGEIAEITGFGSLPVFSRNFKREVGMSPIEYRRYVAGEMG